MMNNQLGIETSAAVVITENLNLGERNKNQLHPVKFDLLCPLRQWLDSLEIQNRKLAKFIAKLIPAQCPFERDIIIFGRKVAHIPPMCKLNPLYEQLVFLRFRALCYLVDQCGEDIQSYC
ncbi:MAG: Mo-dependent nitrogenase C-terminal domain-containing protein [Nostocaceae cyanobacterium]|nr:Mo-dependent nitrogenase C-terminal domain-containing protein [Nostocaceae cyanobacterium]